MASDKTREPSMEDLLASIREIIADDVRQTKPSKPVAKDEKMAPSKTPSLAPASEKKNDDIVLELVNKIDAPQKASPNLVEDDRVRTRLRAETTFDPEHIQADRIEDYLGPAQTAEDSRLASTKPRFRADLEQLMQMNMAQPKASEKDLLDPETVKQTAQALEGLNSVIETTRTEIQSTGVGAKTVEDLMKEILKPLLKTWLDAHLPSLVKWVVAEQVEKILQSRHRNH